MTPYLSDRYANASGSHHLARQARQAVEEARDEVAHLLGARPGEIIFTGSGTEADNLAIFGTLAARSAAGQPGGTVVCSAVEHAAVGEACRAAVRRSAAGGSPLRLVEAPVERDGTVDLAALEVLCDDQVVLVSVMLANNEIGTIQPLGEIGELRERRAPRALLHTDAVQAVPWLDVASITAVADLVTMSAHKLGGPKGVGVLVARDNVALEPIIVGGGQERDRRSGTIDVAGIVGTAVALRVTTAERTETARRVTDLRDRFADAVLSGLDGVTPSAPWHKVLPGHCHLRFEGVEQEELLMLLDDAGICASAGAACASGAVEPSHVLAAMGVVDADARSGIRFTLGRTTTDDEVAAAVAATVAAVSRLRR